MSNSSSSLERPRSGRMLAIAVALLATAACTANNAPSIAPLPQVMPPVAEVPLVAVDENRFIPDELTVEVGTTVRWSWHGRAAHDVVGPGFDSGVMISGDFEHTFTEVGSHPYLCTLHPNMTGTVHVIGGP